MDKTDTLSPQSKEFNRSKNLRGMQIRIELIYRSKQDLYYPDQGNSFIGFFSKRPEKALLRGRRKCDHSKKLEEDGTTSRGSESEGSVGNLCKKGGDGGGKVMRNGEEDEECRATNSRIAVETP
ncbi:hypothetical protein L2E82_20237 [Cichorium intybus]|uniref:Uncharacterized protein n=1 Tax=Cichorium intybus TaxID=13427 RepID=A0ACB9DT14_CICIN|nr:hypothetical protein L2E82_20237 [Cichorium intybus]